MKTLLRPALSLFVLLFAVTGIAYPLATTGIARLVFPSQAAGSLVIRDGKPVGSALIGQNFTHPAYFWAVRRPPRPSLTMPRPPAAPTWAR